MCVIECIAMISGSQSSKHAASSGCGGRNGLQRVAANILNTQSRTADKGWPSSLGVRRGANNSSPLNLVLLRSMNTSLGTGMILCYDMSNGEGHEIQYTECYAPI
jgi:hypothetical protein